MPPEPSAQLFHNRGDTREKDKQLALFAVPFMALRASPQRLPASRQTQPKGGQLGSNQSRNKITQCSHPATISSAASPARRRLRTSHCRSMDLCCSHTRCTCRQQAAVQVPSALLPQGLSKVQAPLSTTLTSWPESK